MHLVPLEEVPRSFDNAVAETTGGESLEDSRAEVQLGVTAAGARVDNDSVDRLAVGLNLDTLTTVVSVVPVVQALANGNDHVGVNRVPTAVAQADVEPGHSAGSLQTSLKDVSVLGLGNGSGVDHGQRGNDGDDSSLGESEHFVLERDFGF